MLLVKNKITGTNNSTLVRSNNKTGSSDFIFVQRITSLSRKSGLPIYSILAVIFMAALGTNSAWAIPVLSFDLVYCNK